MNGSVTTDEGSVETTDEIRAAQRILKQDHRQGLAALNELFRTGKPPAPPLDGPFDGELIALDIAPVVTQLFELSVSFWMPWKGKHLTPANSKGDNIFGRSSRLPFRLLFPFYRGVTDSGPKTFRAFTFKTLVEAGKVDADRQVLKIDYDSPNNPSLSIRRIIDELVQIGDGVYLGKIHFKWWWGSWKMIGYFSLRTNSLHGAP